jgi:glycosyltransferase involved in cell wall biosynthesis
MIESRGKIILDFERMKYPHTGLYHFCLELGRALLLNAGKSETELYFFINEKSKNLFGNGAHYIHQLAAHKLILPDTSKFNVWHATQQGTSYYPYKRKIPVVLTIHDLNFMHGAGKTAAAKKKQLHELQKKVDRANHIVAISEFVLNDLKSHIHLNNTPASVIYNGCNIPQQVRLQTPLQVPDKPFLFSIGTIAEKKNFHVLPALLSNNDYQMVIAGITHDEGYKKRIVEAAKKQGVADRLFFTGPVTESEKYWYYENCTAFVFPSLAEGFGMPVIEAMYFGKPVFLSTATSLPEIGGNAAFYFNDFDPLTMQQTLENGLKHYARQQHSFLIKEHAALFNWNSAAQGYLNIYNGLI